MELTENRAVVLKSNNSILKTSDNRSLDKVELIITKYCNNENMRQPLRRLATLQHAKSFLNLNVKDTQLTTFQ